MRSLHSNIRVCARIIYVIVCVYGFYRPVFSSTHTHTAHTHTQILFLLRPGVVQENPGHSLAAGSLYPPPKQYGGQTQPSLGPSTFS